VEQRRLAEECIRIARLPAYRVDGWEADDVIGTLVRANPGKFRVHTNDMDYGQIATMCVLDGVNMKGVPHDRVPLYKALVGDTSDNIAGIPGFGPTRWLEMEPYWDDILAAIVTGTPEAFVGLPFKPKVLSWLTSEENVKLLQAMLTITYFQNVPMDEVNGGCIVGVPNKTAGRARLAEFFL
jgi:5'-3' exonuclease